MKISFPNRRSGVGVSIGAAIKALLNRHKAEPAQTESSEKDVAQMTSGWDYRPRKVMRQYAADDATAGTSAVVRPESPATNEGGNDDMWFNFVERDPMPEDAIRKAPLSDRACRISS